jgi:hypothetical protein
LEAPNEVATVETIGALEDQHGGWHLAIGCCRQPKKRTQGDGGSRKTFATTRSRMTHHAAPAQHTGRVHKRSTVEKIWQKGPECNNNNRNQGARQQLFMRKDRPSGSIFRKTVKLEIKKQIVGSSTGVWEASDWTLWRGQPLQKKRCPKHHPWKRTKMMLVHLDWPTPY